jgi:S1-C subfamily serine protease
VGPFSLNAEFARTAGLFLEGPDVLAMKGISLGGNTQSWMTRGKAMRFASVSLNRPVIAISEEDTKRAGGQLGYGVLRRFTITFDYSRKQAYLQPNAALKQPFEFDHAGFIMASYGAEFSGLKIFMVIGDTPAAAAGLRDGDEILTIDGKPASSFGLDGARAYFERETGTRTLTVRRGEQTLTVQVQLRSLV